MKKILSLVLVCVLAFSLSAACFAAEPVDGMAQEMATQVEDVVASENGTILPRVDEDGVMPLNLTLASFEGTTTGYIGGSFTVPDSEANKEIRIAWVAKASGSANTDAWFKLEVAGRTVYLPVTGSAAGYVIGNLPAGTYSFSISPYSNVSGTYLYVFDFYSFG